MVLVAALVVGGCTNGSASSSATSTASGNSGAGSGSATVSARPAGLRPDDVITTINGEPATSNIQLEELTLTKKPGDTVSIGYDRAGHSAKATVTLAAQP